MSKQILQADLWPFIWPSWKQFLGQDVLQLRLRWCHHELQLLKECIDLAVCTVVIITHKTKVFCYQNRQTYVLPWRFIFVKPQRIFLCQHDSDNRSRIIRRSWCPFFKQKKVSNFFSNFSHKARTITEFVFPLQTEYTRDVKKGQHLHGNTHYQLECLVSVTCKPWDYLESQRERWVKVFKKAVRTGCGEFSMEG